MNTDLIAKLYTNSCSKIIQKYMDGHIARYSVTDNVWGQQKDAFAEIIINECIKIALESSHRDDDMGAIIAQSIKKHFGIEE